MAIRKNFVNLFIVTLIAAGTIGCDSSTSAGGGASMDELASAASAQRAAEQQQEQEKADAEKKAQAAAEASAPPVKKKAGRPKVGEGGYFTAIVGARRRILNEADRWPWMQAVQHFQAEHGRLPKDHAEFMSRVVEPLEINLGYKEENEEFFYDPNEGEWGEVFVVEKVEQPASQ
jgi:hypothetical protein